MPVAIRPVIDPQVHLDPPKVAVSMADPGLDQGGGISGEQRPKAFEVLVEQLVGDRPDLGEGLADQLVGGGSRRPSRSRDCIPRCIPWRRAAPSAGKLDGQRRGSR
jgi:hypothetical protein